MAEEEQRFDNVTIVNAVDGTTIKGHEAVKAYFNREQELYNEYGSVVIFQCFSINMNAETLKDFSTLVAEIKVNGAFIGGRDTVASVSTGVKRLMLEKNLVGVEGKHMTLFFGGRLMEDAKLFYADHFMMLPAWVQVCLHTAERKDFLELFEQLKQKKKNSSD
jgi:hypothetical protein